jgi:shikimate kinase
MDYKLKRAPGVYLAGFMGSGKTTVARVLADRLGWDFIDLDAEIEAAELATIAHLFETRGEPEFRRIETEALRKVMRRIERGMPSVIALGGGSFVQPVNTELLEGHGISIWLDCPFETIEARINGARINSARINGTRIDDDARTPEADSRPLARDRERFRQLYEERRAAYGLATYRIDADCEVERAVDLILELPCWK